MTEVIDRAGNWILTHETCEVCGSPSWDANPGGVVKGRWFCTRCGHRQSTATTTNTPLPDLSELVA